MACAVGTCGWSYYNPPKGWKEKFKTKLQAYTKLFDLVEINSTFYGIPKLSTAEKWREEADEINPEFEFTIKMSQLITHRNPFKAFWAYDKMTEIAKALRTKILLFQSPASFKPTKDNIKLAKNFFNKVKRDNFIFIWEVRWEKDWNEKIVKEAFSDLKINQVVDPFRQKYFYAKDLVYYRIHGFGKLSMYNYSFSEKELQDLAEKTKQEKKPVYVLFNNSACYENGLEFRKLMQ